MRIPAFFLNMKRRRKRRKLRISAVITVALSVLLLLFLGARGMKWLAEHFSEKVPKQISDDWRLVLVNYENPVPKDYEFTLIELRNDQAVDERIYPDLQAMFDDARSEGISIIVTSSYRNYEDQQAIMDRFIRDFEDQGYSHEEAKEKAEAQVNRPGYSEHQLGIGIDINSEDSSVQSSDHAWRWLQENAWRYGFIQRYPADKTGITHVINEPWHYRYVGYENAKIMKENNWCLEEYLETLR